MRRVVSADAGKTETSVSAGAATRRRWRSPAEGTVERGARSLIEWCAADPAVRAAACARAARGRAYVAAMMAARAADLPAIPSCSTRRQVLPNFMEMVGHIVHIEARSGTTCVGHDPEPPRRSAPSVT